MRLPKSVKFIPIDVEIEEIQLEPEVEEIVEEEPEVQIFQLTEDELDAKLQEAYTKGIEDGAQQVHQDLDAQLDEHIQTILTLAENAAKSQAQFLERAQDYVIDISCKVAEHIIETELKTYPEEMLTIVENAITHLKEASELKIFVSENDYVLLSKHQFHDRLQLPTNISITIQEKVELRRGDFLIETDIGSLYSIIQERIQFLKNKA